MILFSESAFTIVDFVAQRLVYVSWIPMVAVFLTLCLSSDKERQFARLAKISRAVYPGFIALHLSYFIFHPKAGYFSFLVLLLYVIGPFVYFTNPVVWLVYGDDVISLDLKAYRSRRMTVDQIVKSKILRQICFGGLHFIDAFATFGFGCLIQMSQAIPVKDEVLTEGANSYAVSAGCFACLVCFGFAAYTKHKDTQKRLAEELSAEGSVVEAKTEFASEKVPDQTYKQV